MNLHFQVYNKGRLELYKYTRKYFNSHYYTDFPPECIYYNLENFTPDVDHILTLYLHVQPMHFDRINKKGNGKWG